MTTDYVKLLNALLLEGRENETTEYKETSLDPVLLGEYISALSNSALRLDEKVAYIVFGVKDDLTVVGTQYDPKTVQHKNEDLEYYLSKRLSPPVRFEFVEFFYNTKRVVMIKIYPAFDRPTNFNHIAYIRIGSHKVTLDTQPEIYKELWLKGNNNPFEKAVAYTCESKEEILKLLDYQCFFKRLELNVPQTTDFIIKYLISREMICDNSDGTYDILNIGAILFARKLSDFDYLKRKRLQLIKYRGNSKTGGAILKKQYDCGYAICLDEIVKEIINNIPINSFVVEGASRKDVPVYPPLAIRELVVNSVMHQDYSIPGDNPDICLYKNRMEITNPGAPATDVNRIIDSHKSRNEILASFMNDIGFCEEEGKGIDRVIEDIELYQLPAPTFENLTTQTRVTLFQPKEFSTYTKEERIRACYQHASLKYVSKGFMTNQSLVDRFGGEPSTNTSSHIITETVDCGLIKLYDPESTSKRYAKYVPIYA